MRRGIMTLFASLARHLSTGALDELTLTTNGSQLPKYARELADHGVRRINVSLDTLDPDIQSLIAAMEPTAEVGVLEGELARDSRYEDFDFQRVYRTDEYAAQRGLEQMFYDTFKPVLDLIRPISPQNPNAARYMEAAKRYLESP